MNSILLTVVAAVSVAAATSFAPPVFSEEETDGVVYAAATFRDQAFDVVRIDLDRADLRLFWRAPNGERYGSFGSLRSSLEKDGFTLRFATNSGIFTPEFAPAGLHIENGVELRPLNTRDQGYGNFHLMPNGVFYIDEKGAAVVTTDAYVNASPAARFATQSGPMLVVDGEIHEAFTEGSDNLQRRSGVGIVSPHEIVFAISKLPVNFYDFASLFQDALGCSNALFLDGDISLFYSPEAGKSFEGGLFAGIFAVVEKSDDDTPANTSAEGNHP